MHSVAVHWCWVTAHLYVEQISIALIQHCCKSVLQCTAELVLTKICSSLLKAALQNRLTASPCHCIFVLFIQICSDAKPMHCCTGIVTTCIPHCLKNRLTASPCHCKYTYEDLLFTQVCSDAHLYAEQISTGVTALTVPAVSLFCTAQLNSRKCILP